MIHNRKADFLMMSSSHRFFPLFCLSVLALGACTTPAPDINDAKYWQRNSASSSLYMQGPKAQQMLHRNIATCVNEISELEKLGEIRRSIPANYNSGNSIETRTAAEKELQQYDTPVRDGYLYNEYVEYQDFETCMYAKGWERVEHLPYTDGDLARKNYLDRYGNKKKRTYGDRENVTTLNPQSQNPAPYKDTNQ